MPEVKIDLSRLHTLARPVASDFLQKTGTWRNVRPVFKERTPPCANNCPARVPVRDFIAWALEGDLKGAYELIREQHPFPSIMGRVCYHPCEETCNRGSLDQPVDIHALERYVGDFGRGLPVERPQAPARKEGVAVIGSGPAGLNFAYQMARRGYPVTVFEAAAQPGGMLRLGIPAYRLPKGILDEEIRRIAAMGVEFRTSTRLGKDLTWEGLKEYAGLFVSVGAQVGSRLKIPGAELPGVADGVSFLRSVNLGQGAKVGQRVLVLGGGNVAIDVARASLRLGAREVSMACLESYEQMPCHREEKADAEAEGIKILPSRSFLRIVGEGKVVKGVECQSIRSFHFDAQKRPQIDAISDSEHVLAADTVIFAVGQGSDLSFLPQGLRDEWKELASSKPFEYQGRLVLAGGDAASGPARVVDALGAGRRAALAMDAALRGTAVVEENPEVVGYQSINPFYHRPAPRLEAGSLEPGKRISGFDEIVGELSAGQVAEEAKRCFYCGRCNLCGNCWVFCPDFCFQEVNGKFDIKYDFCKGCATCVTECPRGALVTEQEFK